MSALRLPMGQDLGKPVGKESVLGHSCDVHQTGMGKIWLWKGLPLKMEMSMQMGPPGGRGGPGGPGSPGGMPAGPGARGPGGGPPMGGMSMSMSMVATKIDTTTKPPASQFKVPAGYTVKDMKAPIMPGAPAMPGAPRSGAGGPPAR